jgi:hypothetical protein
MGSAVGLAEPFETDLFVLVVAALASEMLAASEQIMDRVRDEGFQVFARERFVYGDEHVSALLVRPFLVPAFVAVQTRLHVRVSAPPVAQIVTLLLRQLLRKGKAPIFASSRSSSHEISVDSAFMWHAPQTEAPFSG